MGRSVVLGVDADGSYTRVACVDLNGVVLSVERAGGGSPTHNADAAEQVRLAVVDALDRAGRRPSDVTALVAGLAAFNRQSDRSWADRFFDIDGLECPLTIVNDTVVAQAGAFAGGPGIIVVAGTGSMILARSQTWASWCETIATTTMRAVRGTCRSMRWPGSSPARTWRTTLISSRGYWRTGMRPTTRS